MYGAPGVDISDIIRYFIEEYLMREFFHHQPDSDSALI
jgi:hypothetical protein